MCGAPKCEMHKCEMPKREMSKCEMSKCEMPKRLLFFAQRLSPTVLHQSAASTTRMC